MDDATLHLNAPVAISVDQNSGIPRIFVSGFSDNGISVFNVGADGTLTSTDNELVSGGLSPVQTSFVQIQGRFFLMSPWSASHQIEVHEVLQNSTLFPIASITNISDIPLRGAYSMHSFFHQGKHYALASSNREHGLILYEIGL